MSGYTVDLDGDLYYVAEWATGKRPLAQGFTSRGEALVVAALFNLRINVMHSVETVDTHIALKDRTPRARSVAVRKG